MSDHLAVKGGVGHVLFLNVLSPYVIEKKY
jgi:hypothetical protein